MIDMPRTIMGLKTRACINGLDKTDFENVKKIPTLETETNEIKNTTIPALDERVTALEQGSSSSEWFELDISTFTKSQEYINNIFYEDNGENYLKYNMILQKYGRTELFLKDTNVYDCYISSMQIDTFLASSDFQITYASTQLSDIFFTQPTNDDEYIVLLRKIIFNPTNSSFSFSENNENNYRNELKLFVMDYKPEENNQPNQPR